LIRWRRSFRPEQKVTPEHQVGFVPAKVVAESKPMVPAPEVPAGGGAIEIELATGVRMRITGSLDAATLKAAVAALFAGRQRGSPCPRACGWGSRPATPTCAAA